MLRAATRYGFRRDGIAAFGDLDHRRDSAVGDRVAEIDARLGDAIPVGPVALEGDDIAVG